MPQSARAKGRCRLTSCLFCNISDGTAPVEGQPENIVLYESQNFYVKPALGQFIEGYCLIVSKEHVRTMAELPSDFRNELRDLLDEFGHRLSRMYPEGRCVFEHGSICPQNRAGSCIDHAHVHLLPVNCDVRSELVSTFHCRRLDQVTGLHSLDGVADSYLYYESGPAAREVYLCEHRLPSQAMRKLVCERLGIPTRWDWRANPYRDAISRFLQEWHHEFGSLGSKTDSGAVLENAR